MDDFRKDFTRTKNVVWIAFAVNAIVALAIIGFVGWVIIKVLVYFGVV